MGTDGNLWSLSQMAPLNPWGPLIYQDFLAVVKRTLIRSDSP